MSTRLLYTGGLGVGLLSLSAFYLWPLHIVYIDGFWCSVYWSIRSWLWSYPISSNDSIWDKIEDPGNHKKWVAAHVENCRKWNFLRPLFSYHGYDLYEASANPRITSKMWARPGCIPRVKSASYPHAEFIGEADDSTVFINQVRTKSDVH
jgi:hypothetical protein